MPQSQKLLKSTAIVSVFTLLSRVLGLVRDVVLMNVFGASGLMDAFLVAFKIPNFLRRLFAEGAFAQTFVPVIADYQKKSNQNNFHDLQILISRVFGTLLLLLSVLTSVVMMFAPVVIGAFAMGFIHEPDKFATATTLLRLTFPYLLLITLTAFASSVLQSYQRFVIPTVTPILLNICFIIFATWLSPYFAEPILALGYAVLLAGVLQLGLQLLPLYQQNLLILPKVDFAHTGVRQILKGVLPAIFGVSVLQINLLINTSFASFLPTGSVSWLYTAERMSELPLGVIGVAIGTVILPHLSHNNNEQNFIKTLDWACWLVLLIGLPASLALIQISDILMLALFQHGRFGSHDALMSGFALQCMAGGILAFMLIKIFAPAFFAKHQGKIPVKAGIIAIVANAVSAVVLLGIFSTINLPLHGALALATTLSAWANVAVLYYYLKKQQLFKFNPHSKKRMLQLCVANGVMLIALQIMITLFPTNASQIGKILAFLAICVGGMLVYAVGLFLAGFRFGSLKSD